MTDLPIHQSYRVTLYTASTKPDHADHRLAVIRWKEKTLPDKTKVPAPPARAVSLQIIKLQISPACVSAALQTAFEEMQDILIRRHIEEALEASKEPEPIPAADLSPEAVATYAAEEALGGKLSKAKIEAWFDLSLKPDLEMAIAALPGMDDNKMTKSLTDYRLAFVKLSSPQANFNETVATQLKRALLKITDQDQISRQLSAKLDTFLKPKTETLELVL